MNVLKSWREALQIVLFLGFYGIFHTLYFELPDAVLCEVVYNRSIGVFCSKLIHLVSPLEQVSAVQNHLQSPVADLEIVRGCDGAGALFLVMAAILAFPASIKRKLIGLVLGITLIYSLNLVRISGLYFVVAYHNDWFQVTHTYLAPTLLIIVACLFFAWWALGSSKHSSKMANEPR
jgi:exosortase family protein XrtM